MPSQFWVKEDHRAPLLICLVGPIEYWWNQPNDPDRFNSELAVRYRQFRQDMSDFLSARGYLVYRPHEAFKGGWDERAQDINDKAIKQADLVIDLTPAAVPVGKGTNRELNLAIDSGKHVYFTFGFHSGIPSGRAISHSIQYMDEFNWDRFAYYVDSVNHEINNTIAGVI